MDLQMILFLTLSLRRIKHLYSDYPDFTYCTTPNCITAQKVKNNFTQQKPTNDPFLNNKLDGEYSSSYYVKLVHVHET